MQPSILVVNGPGLGEPANDHGDSHGEPTLSFVREACETLAAELGVGLDFRQAEDNEEMFRWLTAGSDGFDAIIINPGEYLETGAQEPGGYRSAVQVTAGLGKPVIEVHLQNIYSQGVEITGSQRQPAGNMGFICGFGKDGYLLAIRAIEKMLVPGEMAMTGATT